MKHSSRLLGGADQFFTDIYKVEMYFPISQNYLLSEFENWGEKFIDSQLSDSLRSAFQKQKVLETKNEGLWLASSFLQVHSF